MRLRRAAHFLRLLRGRTLPSEGDRHERDDRGGANDADAPPDATDASVPADPAIERDAAGARLRDPDCEAEDAEVVLVAAVAGEVPVRAMHGRDRGEHHDGDRESL